MLMSRVPLYLDPSPSTVDGTEYDVVSTEWTGHPEVLGRLALDAHGTRCRFTPAQLWLSAEIFPHGIWEGAPDDVRRELEMERQRGSSGSIYTYRLLQAIQRAFDVRRERADAGG